MEGILILLGVFFGWPFFLFSLIPGVGGVIGKLFEYGAFMFEETWVFLGDIIHGSISLF